MEQARKRGLLLSLLLVTGYTTIYVLKWFNFGTSSGELWGLAVGCVVGCLGAWYFFVSWDPVKLQPRNPKTRSARDVNPGCVLPLIAIAIAITNGILARFVGMDMRQFIGGMLFPATMFPFAFVIIQSWRHRPRQRTE